MSQSQPLRVARRRLSGSLRALIGAAAGGGLSLALLTAHVFAPEVPLQVASLCVLGLSFFSLWLAVLAWRMPILDSRRRGWLATLWILGIAASVALVLLARREGVGLAWRLSVQWLALTLSLCVGGLLLRALLRVRTSPLLGRLVSLISPLGILLLILLLGRDVT